MKRLLLIVLTICSLAIGIAHAQDREIRGITDKLAESLSQSGKKTVAVVDFTDLQGNVTELGRFLAEEISASLAEGAKGIQVVDRTNLEVIIQENRLVHRGIIDPATAKKLGQIAGVDALITGNLTQFGDSVHLSIKILDTATAKIVGATRGDIPKTKAIEELLGKGVATAINGPHPLPQPPSGPKQNQPSTEVRGVRVVADNCRAEGETLVCTLMVTSQQQERRLRIVAGAEGRYVFQCNDCYLMAYDEAGIGHGSDSITFAAMTSGPERWMESLLVSDVPTRLMVKFNQFNASSARVTLLKFGCILSSQGENYTNYATVFELRNIPILK
jgi:TolB-like protein